MIVEEFFKKNNISIISKQPSLPDHGRIDFIISKDERNKTKFNEMYHNIYVTDYFTDYNISELEPYFLGKIKFPSINVAPIHMLETDKILEEEKKKYSVTDIKEIYDGKFYRFYDTSEIKAHRRNEFYKFLKKNFILVEVKTTTKDKFLKLSGKGKTKRQIDNMYCDYYLRVKIIPDISENICGMLNEEDVRNILNDSRLK